MDNESEKPCLVNQKREVDQLISKANRLVAFTGAGISAESGIPTYRGDDGVWHKYDASLYADIANFRKDPSYYWRFFKEVRYPVMQRARANSGHGALAALEKSGKLIAIITQNIDGLHQAAGAEKVLELHGNTRRISCLECGQAYSMDSVYAMLETHLPPTCSACNGMLKPEVVFFGESLPADVLSEAVRVTKACDLFLVVGSSLVVQPAAGLPVLAKQNGARLVIINKEPTPLDALADLVVHAGATEILNGGVLS